MARSQEWACAAPPWAGTLACVPSGGKACSGLPSHCPSCPTGSTPRGKQSQTRRVRILSGGRLLQQWLGQAAAGALPPGHRGTHTHTITHILMCVKALQKAHGKQRERVTSAAIVEALSCVQGGLALCMCEAECWPCGHRASETPLCSPCP